MFLVHNHVHFRVHNSGAFSRRIDAKCIAFVAAFVERSSASLSRGSASSRQVSSTGRVQRISVDSFGLVLRWQVRLSGALRQRGAHPEAEPLGVLGGVRKTLLAVPVAYR